jgi:hypothetical protein
VLERLITSLESRVFLLHNVNQDGPVVFQTRWAMSYLRGPLTRQQVKQLMTGRKPAAAPALARKPAGESAAGMPATSARPISAPAATAPAATDLSSVPPVAPPGVNQVFLPVAVREGDALHTIESNAGGRIRPTGQQVVFQPGLIGIATVTFNDRKLGLDETQDVALMLPVDPEMRVVDWRDAQPVQLAERDLGTEPPRGASFVGSGPASISSARALGKLETDLADYLYRNQSFSLLYHPALKLYAEPGETERDFRARVQQAAREARDEAVDKIRDRYEAKINRLATQKSKEEQELAEDKAQLQGRVGEEILSGLDSVAGIFGLFGSRRRKSLTGLSKAASKRRITAQAQADIDESVETIKRLEGELETLRADMEAEMSAATEEWSKVAEELQQVQVNPRKSDIDVRLVALAWAPTWEVSYEDSRGFARTESVPAFKA